MTKLLVVALSLIAAPMLMLSSLNAAQQEVDLTGTYTCEGVNPDGQTYESTVEIVKHEGTYRLIWTNEPVTIAVGIGILDDDRLAVSVFSNGIVGVVVYKVEKGTLTGQWTALGAEGSVYPETLTKVGMAASRQPAPVHPSAPR